MPVVEDWSRDPDLLAKAQEAMNVQHPDHAEHRAKFARRHKGNIFVQCSCRAQLALVPKKAKRSKPRK